MADDIQGLNRLLSRIGQMATDTRHVERPLKAAGAYVVGSIEKNFQQQGRPQRWSPLATSTLAARRKGRGRGSARILIDTAKMKNAVHYTVTTEGTVIGLNAVQAARQHFGYQGGSGRGQTPTPARPFLLLQEPEDVRAIGEMFRRHIARK